MPDVEHPDFYEDEVDIHLNPKIGADWQLHGQQKRVITLGQNKSTILPERSTAVREKSATLVEIVKVHPDLSAG